VLAHYESLILAFSTFPYALIARNKSEEAKMFPTFFTSLVLLLSTLNLAICSSDLVQPAAALAIRQVSAAPATADLCIDYEFTANMSTVGANSSYRTVLLQKSMTGTIANARMMDAAIAKLPALTADVKLNEDCGNKTEIALREAEKNFTMGIVAQFTTDNLPVGIRAGPELIAIVAAIVVLFSAVWING
jgi:hypothetical protein